MQEGPELLLRCDKCGTHMQADRIFKHWHLEKFHKLTKRKLRWRDVEMAARCGEMEFSIYGEEGDEILENITTLRYLGIPLDQTDDAMPSV